MRKLKLFPKIFLYSFCLMLFVSLITHGLIFLLAPRMQLALDMEDAVVVSINPERFITQAIKNALPLSMGCSFFLSALCSLFFSRAITGAVRKISDAAGQMMTLNQSARCPVDTEDEIGVLAENINQLYLSLLSSIKHLRQEKETVQRLERARTDFLRAASHELKTPVTALGAILENMILGVGKYKDYAEYLPECKELTDQLSGMIREILEASRLYHACETEKNREQLELTELLFTLCQPYKLIAAAKGISFSLKLPEHFCAALPADTFKKAISNVLSNAVAYTEPGRAISVYLSGRSLIIENECTPIPEDELSRLSEPFYRPDFSRSRESGGNGLGLYIVDTLLTSAKLSYSFAPMKNPEGMRFTFYL